MWEMFRREAEPQLELLRDMAEIEDIALEQVLEFPAEERAQKLKITIQEIEFLIMELDSIISNLQKINHDWFKAMLQMKPAQRAEEEKIHHKLTEDKESLSWSIRRAISAKNRLNSQQRRILRADEESSPSPIQAREQSGSARVAEVKLPRMELPHFNGDMLKWPEFWGIFESTIHSQHFPEVQKLNYLLSCLEGDAARAVQGFSVSAENYEVVVKALKEKFGNVEIIKSSLYSELQEVERADDNIKDMVENVERILRQLEALQEDVNHPMFGHTIEKKCPQWVMEEVLKMKKTDPNWSVSRLRDYLKDLVITKTMASAVCTRQRQLERMTPTKFKTMKSQRTVAFATTQQYDKKKSKGLEPTYRHQCVFCNEMHWNDQCMAYKTAEQRRQRAIEKQLCLNCLNKGHFAYACQTKKVCFHCKGKHNSALCAKKTKYDSSSVNNKAATSVLSRKGEKGDDEIMAIHTSISADQPNKQKRNGTVLLMCREITLLNSETKKQCKAIAFFDVGSQSSFITKRLANKLAIHGTRKKLAVTSFGSQIPRSLDSETTSIDIKTKSGRIQSMQVNIVDCLTARLQVAKVPASEKTKRLHKLKVSWEQPDILIGMDNYFKFMEPTPHRQLPSGFQLISTKVGGIIAGTGHTQADKTVSTVMSVCHATAVEKEVENFWSLELMGIQEQPEENDDDVALKLFQQSVVKSGKRYQVGWPWKEPHKQINSHYGLCFGRLKSVAKRLQNKPGLLKKYDEVFQEQLSSGIIEEVNEEMNEGIVHYVPHQEVITPTKETTKIRVVFDASARLRRGDKSLNDMLYRGPIILPELTGIIMRFREMGIVIMGDVEKAFHQLELKESDRNCTRFLWLRNYDAGVSSDNVVKYRFARVPFGVVSAPFLLMATLQHHLRMINTTTSIQTLRNLYVDNVLISANDTGEAIQKYHELKDIFDEASMNIRQFFSNDNQFNAAIPEKDRWNEEQVKVLGIRWNVKLDVIEMNVLPWNNGQATKRNILRFVASHFDPIGFLVPVLLPLKLFLQVLWKKNYGWDDALRTDDEDQFQNLMRSWQYGRFEIPRRIQEKQQQLHVFTDASQCAYAAVAYLSSVNGDSFMIFAKSRLAPIKPTTIPRLELLSVLIGTRMLNYIVREMNLDSPEQFLWTDSQCVIHWIGQENIQQPRFIQNRLQEIRNTKAQIRYVPTDQNPADIATRTISTTNLQNSTLWWKGPDWLRISSENWPKWTIDEKSMEFVKDEVEEVRSSNEVYSCLMVPKFELIDANRFSKWRRMQRVTMWTIRFLKKISKDKIGWLKHVSAEGAFKVEDYETAKTVLCRQAQQELHGDKGYQKWSPEIDSNGLVRCSGRLGESDLPVAAKQPLLLPRKHRITELLIHHIHEEAAHAGANQTLALLRQNFWVEKGQSTVKRSIRNCMVCRRWRAKPFKLPTFPVLPASRVCRSRVFDSTGLDYLGPISVKGEVGNQKKWIALFTCLATRLIHLEVIEDLSAEEFLKGLRRFIARRGTPTNIICDNATQFVSGSKVLQSASKATELRRDENILDYASERGIHWKFITPFSPWMGGVYERLIGITKDALRKAMGKKRLRKEDVATVVTEIEAIINSRPLAQCNQTSVDVIRPIDFVIPGAKIGSVIRNMDINDEDEEYLPPEAESYQKLNRCLTKRIQCIDKMWEIWRSQYLMELRQRTQNEHRQGRSLNRATPKLHEVVMIQEEGVPRGMWKLARIVDLLQQKDGGIRSAVVELSNGKRWKRPVSLLYSLEINLEDDSDNDNSGAKDGQKTIDDDGAMVGINNNGADRGNNNGEVIGQETINKSGGSLQNENKSCEREDETDASTFVRQVASVANNREIEETPIISVMNVVLGTCDCIAKPRECISLPPGFISQPLKPTLLPLGLISQSHNLSGIRGDNVIVGGAASGGRSGVSGALGPTLGSWVGFPL